VSDRCFHGDAARLRAPERLARLELDRVVASSLADRTIKSILDVGTGTGVFAQAFANQGLAVTGVDVNPEMIASAQRHVPSVRFEIGAAEELPFLDRCFDLVFLGHVLHESEDPGRALKEAVRVAREGIVIVEWPYLEEELGPPLEHRLKPEAVETLVRGQGLLRFERLTLRNMELYRIEL
jgi:ubiquinone/menaquinone biosynthesis C-methylase UbiE